MQARWPADYQKAVISENISLIYWLFIWMKRTASIVTILLVLASAAGVTIDRHYCGGRVVDVRLAIDGRHATCGMEQDGEVCPYTPAYRQNCCHNVLSRFSVNDYSITSLLTIDSPAYSITHVIPEAPEASINNSFSSRVIKGDTGPPGPSLPVTDKQSILCIFRI